MQKRKEERQREGQLQVERDQQAENLRVGDSSSCRGPSLRSLLTLSLCVPLLQGKVMAAVQKWAFDRPATGSRQQQTMGVPPSAPLPRDLVLLLCSMHSILAYIPGPDAVLNPDSLPQPPSSTTCPPVEVSSHAPTNTRHLLSVP